MNKQETFSAGDAKRSETLAFANQHDDGAGLDSLHEADVVIVGISHVGKSLTARHLAGLGVKAANVPIVQGRDFPTDLDRVTGKIAALTIQPKTLHEHRKVRFGESEVYDANYYSLDRVIHEVMDSETQYRRRGYPIIDVTDKTIEQIAAAVLERLKPAG